MKPGNLYVFTYYKVLNPAVLTERWGFEGKKPEDDSGFIFLSIKIY